MGWLAPAARAAVLERVAVVVPDGVLDEAVARPVEPVLGNGHVLTACVDRELAETASTGRYRGGVVKSAVSTNRPDVLDTSCRARRHCVQGGVETYRGPPVASRPSLKPPPDAALRAGAPPWPSSPAPRALGSQRESLHCGAQSGLVPVLPGYGASPLVSPNCSAGIGRHIAYGL